MTDADFEDAKDKLNDAVTRLRSLLTTDGHCLWSGARRDIEASIDDVLRAAGKLGADVSMEETMRMGLAGKTGPTTKRRIIR